MAQPLLRVVRRVFSDDRDQIDAVLAETGDVEWATAGGRNAKRYPHRSQIVAPALTGGLTFAFLLRIVTAAFLSRRLRYAAAHQTPARDSRLSQRIHPAARLRTE